MIPGESGPVEARTPNGHRVDLFDFTDYLAAKYRRIYVVDLDGIEHNRPQLDYLQELTKDTDVWIDGGTSSGDGVIDILVAGARRAVVGPSRLRDPRELKRALALTTELAFEIELDAGGAVRRRAGWPEEIPAILDAARGLGITEVILSPRVDPVDWRLAAEIASGGSLWVDGTLERSEEGRLAEIGASGGLFHVPGELPRFEAEGPPP